MKNSISPNKIKNQLNFCHSYWVIIYGSYLKEEFISGRSDIDIAIITRTKDKLKNLDLWRSLLVKVPKNYDLRIFELLPLHVQIDIIQNYLVLFGDTLEISEYFYQYRNIWKEMINRIKSNQFQNIQEKLNLIEHRKKVIG